MEESWPDLIIFVSKFPVVKGHIYVRRSTIDALAELLGTVVLVEEVVGNFLQVTQVAVKESAANGEEVGVTRVLNLDNSPWVLACAHFAVIDLDEILGSNNGEGHQTTQLGILLHGVLVILLDVVGEVVDGDTVVLNVLHDQLLRLGQFGGGEGVGLSDNGNDVDTRGEALHQFNVEFTQTVASGCDEVKQDVNSVVSEARVTLDS